MASGRRGAVRRDPAVENVSLETDSSKGELFEALSNRRRRQTLHYLVQRDDSTVTKRELARQIAAWETGQPADQVSSDERKRVYVALHQTHLPKLADAELVRYDDARGTITLGDEADDLDVYLDVVEDDEIPWSQFYLGLAVVCLGVSALVAIGLPPFDLVPSLGWAVAFSLAFGAASLAHVHHDRANKLGTGDPPAAEVSDGGRPGDADATDESGNR